MRIGALFVALLLVAVAAQVARGERSAIREFGIYGIRIDGTGRTQLLNGNDSGIVDVVDVSPNRKRILVYRSGSNDLYAAASDGIGLTPVISSQAVGGSLGLAAWSPSGQRLAGEVFSIRHGAEIWVAASDGRSLRRLVRRALGPSWSPDGRRIAYIGSFFGHDPAGAVTVGMSSGPLRPRRLGATEFGDTNTDNWTLRWSPPGDLVGYTTFRDGRERVGIVRVNGPLRRSVATPRAGRFAAWSPTGKRMLYWEGTSHRLIVARPDGRRRRFLTTGVGTVSWSPDARWIAFVDSVGRRCYQIFLIRPNGQGRRQLTNEACSARFRIFWKPDSQRLIYILRVYDP